MLGVADIDENGEGDSLVNGIADADEEGDPLTLGVGDVDNDGESDPLTLGVAVAEMDALMLRVPDGDEDGVMLGVAGDYGEGETHPIWAQLLFIKEPSVHVLPTEFYT